VYKELTVNVLSGAQSLARENKFHPRC